MPVRLRDINFKCVDVIFGTVVHRDHIQVKLSAKSIGLCHFGKMGYSECWTPNSVAMTDL